MALRIGDNFSYQARKPLDERLTFDTLSEMASLSDSVLYTGLMAFNNATKKFYVFDANNTVDITLGKWREFTATGASFTAAIDNTIGSPTEGHLIITFSDGTTMDCGYVLGSNVATIAEYDENTAYEKDAVVYLGRQFARVKTDYTSGSITTTIEDLFKADTNLEIMSHDSIDDTQALSDKTYSSSKIDTLIAASSSKFEGSCRTDTAADLPTNPNAGAWVIIEDCTTNYPGQGGIGAYDGSTWNIVPIPSGTFVFPEPTDDGKLYFRKRTAGVTNGDWELFNGIDGSSYEIKVRVIDGTDTTFIPAIGEPVWDTSRNCLIIGDGTTTAVGMKPFYEATLTSSDVITALGFTPEDIANKGQAFGYAPLDANGLVPTANLPASATSTYSKAEVDQKDADTLAAATLLVNTEATTARTNENNIQSNLDTHVNNNAIHVTQSEKDGWDAKVDQSDLTQYDNHLSDTIIHVTQSDKDKWNGMNKSYYVLNKSDLPTTGNTVGNIGFVHVSAAGVTPVVVDQYLWNGTAWVERDINQTTLSLTWGNIQGKPTSTPLALDNSVILAHNHTNKQVLDKIGQTATGSFTFNGQEIGVRIIFVANQSLLPVTGEEDTLYVVYEDNRVRNYPSISVWRDGAYQILGRGTQDAPPAVGDMSILQNEYFSVSANSKYRIKVQANQYFAFMPLEILKEVPGKTGQNRNIVNFSNPDDYEYDDSLLDIDSTNKLSISIKELSTIVDTVGDQYHSYVDVDLSKFVDIGGII